MVLLHVPESFSYVLVQKVCHCRQKKSVKHSTSFHPLNTPHFTVPCRQRLLHLEASTKRQKASSAPFPFLAGEDGTICYPFLHDLFSTTFRFLFPFLRFASFIREGEEWVEKLLPPILLGSEKSSLGRCSPVHYCTLNRSGVHGLLLDLLRLMIVLQHTSITGASSCHNEGCPVSAAL